MKNYDIAKNLHQKYPLVDAHIDLPCEIFFRNKRGENKIIENHYLQDIKKAGVKILVGAIFTDPFFSNTTALSNALAQINAIKNEIAESDDLILITNSEDIDTVLKTKKIGIILSIEGLEPLGEEIGLLDTFYDLGVRAAGLVWSRRNLIGDGGSFDNNENNKKNGLSSLGFDVLEKMKDLSMIIDISHLNDGGNEDVFSKGGNSIIASHSNARALNDLNRNLSDQALRSIKKCDGVIGLNNLKPIIGGEDNFIFKMCDHIDYMRTKIGIDHIGFGFDLCKGIDEIHPRFGNIMNSETIDALANHSESILITEELLNRGYSEKDLSKILGGNFIRVFRRILGDR